MNCKKIWDRRTLIATIMSLSATKTSAAGPSSNRKIDDVFAFQNPIETVTVRDCQIIRAHGRYVMTGTFPPFWGETSSPGVRVTSSSDLFHWSEPQVIIRPDNWYRQLFWAPEIFPYLGKYFVTFNCPSIGAAPIGDGKQMHLSVGLAVAESIEGPYDVITKAAPLIEGNDGTLFLDADGKVYLYHTVETDSFEGIGCTPVDLLAGKTCGETTVCLVKEDKPGWDGGKKVGIEGPSVFRRGPTYYLIYSGWGRGYEVGFATSASATGPWQKSRRNPIFGAQDPDWAKNFSGTYDQEPSIPFGQVGHGSPFFGPDGRLWFGCHGIMQKGKGYDLDPHLVLAPMNFERDGSIAMSLTWTKQFIDLSEISPDPYWRESGSPASIGW